MARAILAMLLCGLILLGGACAGGVDPVVGDPAWDRAVEGHRTDARTVAAGIPDEIGSWVANSAATHLGQWRSHDGLLYILVTAGQKPTGGHSVNIENVEVLEDRIRVTVSAASPVQGKPVTDAITHPYDLVVVENAPDVPVVFEPAGEWTYVPTLYGLSYLPPIAAESMFIKVFTPAPEQQVQEEFRLTGVANVFEGHVVYQVLDQDGVVLADGFVMGAMGDWGYFDETVRLPAAVRGELILLLFSPSPRDGEPAFAVALPLVAR